MSGSGGASIHPTALIEPGAVIGKGATIGPYCIVGGNVTVGDGCKLVARPRRRPNQHWRTNDCLSFCVARRATPVS
jgi:NDP-sugar pyrophosphorylase family protein